MRRLSLSAVLIAASALAACSTVATDVRGPSLTAASYAYAPPGGHSPSAAQLREAATAPPASANSLWRANSRTFFNDQRASRVGDILTVQISIDDSAQVSNATSRTRSNNVSNGLTQFLGFERNLQKVLPGNPNLPNAIEFGGDASSQGQGSVNRQEKINLTVAAVVAAVLPNGNMIIQGRQEVRTNAEVRELTVAGMVRPEDISSSNTIRHTQIAEARISYGGRGDISRVQRPPVGQSLVERFSPF